MDIHSGTPFSKKDYIEQKIITLQYDYMKRKSSKAWLLVFNRKRAWLAKNLCEIDTKTTTINVPQWLAEKYGIEAYEI